MDIVTLKKILIIVMVKKPYQKAVYDSMIDGLTMYKACKNNSEIEKGSKLSQATLSRNIDAIELKIKELKKRKIV